MKKTIILCDRCGEKIPDNQKAINFASIGKKDAVTGDIISNKFIELDFCDQCIDEITKCIKKSQAQPKKATTKTKEPRKPTFDVGKAQALRDNGWSIIRIAQEMKVSEPTILKWTHPAEPKQQRPNEWAENEPDLKPTISAIVEAHLPKGV